MRRKNDIKRGEFFKKVHNDAIKWRQEKVREILDRGNPTELEISIIKQWGDVYGNEAW